MALFNQFLFMLFANVFVCQGVVRVHLAVCLMNSMLTECYVLVFFVRMPLSFLLVFVLFVVLVWFYVCYGTLSPLVLSLCIIILLCSTWGI